MADIFDIFNPELASIRWRTLALDNEPYLGDTLFNTVREESMIFENLSGVKGTPRVLAPYTGDTEEIPRERGIFSKQTYEMMGFKESMYLDENLMLKLYDFRNNGGVMAESIINKIYNDPMTLLEAAAVQRERMRMEALTTGSLTITGNGVNTGPLNFDIPQMDVSVVWSNTATSNPFADIKGAQESIRLSYGSAPRRAITNTVTFTNMINSQSFKNTFFPIISGSATTILTEQQIRAYLMSELGLSIAIYDKRFIDETGQSRKFVDDGVFVLIQDGAVGNMHMGYTVDERMFMSNGNQGLSQRTTIVDNGVALRITIKPDAPKIQTTTTMICMPTITDPLGMVILDTETAA